MALQRVSAAMGSTFGSKAPHQRRNIAFLVAGLLAAAAATYLAVRYHGPIGQGFQKFGQLIVHKWNTSRAARAGMIAAISLVGAGILAGGAKLSCIKCNRKPHTNDQAQATEKLATRVVKRVVKEAMTQAQAELATDEAGQRGERHAVDWSAYFQSTESNTPEAAEAELAG